MKTKLAYIKNKETLLQKSQTQRRLIVHFSII
jgi:hypothetical protein